MKVVFDEVENELTEKYDPNPNTHLGKSKLLAEYNVLSKAIPEGKRIYVIRSFMIHGPGNKGDLNLLYKIVSKNLPWPFGVFENKRSFCRIDYLMFIIKDLINREDIPSGIYNIAANVPLSTNEVIGMIAESKSKKANILKLSAYMINVFVYAGDFLKLLINSERLQKLIESYVVSNAKIKQALGKELPISSQCGLINTFQSFSDNV